MRALARTVVVILLAAGLATAVAPAASAGTTLCREADAGGTYVRVCVDLGENGTTLAPNVTVECTICALVPIGVGATGFVASGTYPTPAVDPLTASVRIFGGTVGWLYVNGVEIPVTVDDYCVGDPSFCA